MLNDDLTPERIKQLDARWKSDFDKRLSDLNDRLKELEAAAIRIETIFTQASGVLVFVKWSSAVAVAIAGAWAWVSTHLTYK